jgi:hypothetical protein
MALDGQSPGLGDEVFRNCDVFARLLSVPGFLDSSKRRFRCRRIACYKLAAGNKPYAASQSYFPVFIPIMPTSRFSRSRHVRSMFFVKKYEAKPN